MAIKQAIRSLALADVELSGFVGSRFAPIVANVGDVLPRISYQRNEVDSSVELLDVNNFRRDTFSIFIDSESYLECDNIFERLKFVYESIENVTEDGTFIHRFYLESYSESSFLPEGREKPIYSINCNWGVTFVA